MGPYRKHVFVCTSGSVCPVEGEAVAVHYRLKQLVKASGLEDNIRVNNSGCFSQCGHGPMVVIYPDDVWYGAVTPADADEIFHEHLLGGRVIERLLYRPPKPGANKIVRKASAPESGGQQ